jgi:hypothetical protein
MTCTIQLDAHALQMSVGMLYEITTYDRDAMYYAIYVQGHHALRHWIRAYESDEDMGFHDSLVKEEVIEPAWELHGDEEE